MKDKSPTFITEVSKSNPIYQEFIDTCRALLRGSGSALRLNGRHANRKQFYKNDRYLRRKYRQDFPLNLATSIYINLRPSANNSDWMAFNKQVKAVRPILQNLVQMYKNNGTNIFIERS